MGAASAESFFRTGPTGSACARAGRWRYGDGCCCDRTKFSEPSPAPDRLVAAVERVDPAAARARRRSCEPGARHGRDPLDAQRPDVGDVRLAGTRLDVELRA